MLARITMDLPADLISRTKAAAAVRGDTLSDIVQSRLEDYLKESQAKLQAADTADWQRLGIEQFFAGYSESDAIYDRL